MSGESYEAECLVIGAGVVGLACAAELARRGREVLIAEAAAAIGTGVSSRNSEVIHAGLYYPTNSLKHLLCVRGRRLLYPFLDARGIAHRKCGKLVVATSLEEQGQIETLYRRARDNDVEDISLLTGAEALALEPNLHCVSGLLSAQTGLVDSHGLMLALLGELEAHGGALALNAPVLGGAALDGGGFDVRVGGAGAARVRCRTLVNAAGLCAQRVACSVEGVPAHAIPHLVLAKGSYFGCVGKPAFSRLIYPAPVEGGLGVHLTLDLAGRMRFGPDVEWLDETNPDGLDYTVDPRRADAFYAAIRRYWPGLGDGALTPDYSGCRPKLSGPGQAAADFRIDGRDTHGLEGLVNLFGIESPGLTSALAIAETIADQLGD
jgi:L-2-hydroxyglutarate oxidase LhgO